MRLSPQYDAALVMAMQLHATQMRKGSNIPYVSHLLAVSSLVIEYGGTEDQAIAGLLHDAVEDQNAKYMDDTKTLDRIRERFGSGVADIVDHCTDADEDPKPEWRPRKEKYIADLANMPKTAALVSCADKLHNARAILSDLRDVGGELWERFTGKKKGTLWYYRSLVDAFDKVFPGRLTEELRRTVEDIEREATLTGVNSADDGFEA
jgi:(p)ppGpp synthase/HD superfamily hydrolase